MERPYIRAGIAGIVFGVGLYFLGIYKSSEEANVWNDLISYIGAGVTGLGVYGLIRGIMKQIEVRPGELEKKINPEVSE